MNKDKVIPYSLDAAIAMPDWQSQFCWPISHIKLSELLAQQLDNFFKFIESINDEFHRSVILLMIPGVIPRVRALTEAAYLLYYMEKKNIKMTGLPTEFEILNGSHSGDFEEARTTQDFIKHDPSLLVLRRGVRTLTWTPLHRLFKAIISPDIIAVSHNELLSTEAKRSNKNILFKHSQPWLNEIRNKYPDNKKSDDLNDVKNDFINCLVNLPGFPDNYINSFKSMVLTDIDKRMFQAANDLRALEKADDIPQELWSGSGGEYAARALGLEVIRRGGVVKRFDHGGPAGFIENNRATELYDYTVSTSIVTATKKNAELCFNAGLSHRVSTYRNVKIEYTNGYRSFIDKKRGSSSFPKNRPKVLYVPTVYYGFNVPIPPILSDPVYLDWQIRLLKMLGELDLDIYCKPHPEGLKLKNRNPLEHVVNIIKEPFESIISEMDILIFDYPMSTTVWHAMCTRRKIIFLDFGIIRFRDEVMPIIKERCSIINVDWNDRNIPVINKEELNQALFNSHKIPEINPFEQILIGANC